MRRSLLGKVKNSYSTFEKLKFETSQSYSLQCKERPNAIYATSKNSQSAKNKSEEKHIKTPRKISFKNIFLFHFAAITKLSYNNTFLSNCIKNVIMSLNCEVFDKCNSIFFH